MLKKDYDIRDLIKLLKARNILLSKNSIDDEYTDFIDNISIKCDKVSIKMTSCLVSHII